MDRLKPLRLAGSRLQPQLVNYLKASLFTERKQMSQASNMSSENRPITIVGAGVLGLSTARILQHRHPKTDITIVAAEAPTLPNSWTASIRPSVDYASMWAGAHYRPIPRSTRQLHDEADLAFRTAEVMYKIAEENPEAGVSKMPAAEYLEKPPAENLALVTGDLYAGPGDQFRVLEKDELPEGVNWGCKYQAWCINVHVYCAWLLGKFLETGGRIIQDRLSSLNDAFNNNSTKEMPVVVNCSGRNFDNDPKMQIIRGQTVLVKNEYHSTITRQTSDGGWVFLIPRPGGAGTVVGGTKEVGDAESQPRPETRHKLLTEAVHAFPDFVDDISKFEVVMDNVGRRPWREGGLRIELEELRDDRSIVHGYGAGGRGYELSWGVAERIADLCDQVLQRRSSKARL